MNLKKILIWVGAALVLFFLVQSPIEFGHLVHGGLVWLGKTAQAIIVAVRTTFGW